MSPATWRHARYVPWRVGVLFAAVIAAGACRVPESEQSTAERSDERSRGGAASSDMIEIQGHRGARGLVPENTLPSFQRALDLGVRTLEMDVVVSADGQAVVSHDPLFLATICSHPSGAPVLESEQEELVLYEMPYERIRTFDCGRRGHADFPGQRPRAAHKPLLDEVIRLGEAHAMNRFEPVVRYNIEIKSTERGDGTLHPEPDAFSRLVLDVVRSHGIALRTTIQSFDPRVLRALHAMDAPVTLALLLGRSEDRGLEENLRALGFTPPIYSPDHRLVDETLVRAVHERGMKLVTWTVNEAARMIELQEMGVDGIITDYPDVAVETLRTERP